MSETFRIYYQPHVVAFLGKLFKRAIRIIKKVIRPLAQSFSSKHMISVRHLFPTMT